MFNAETQEPPPEVEVSGWDAQPSDPRDLASLTDSQIEDWRATRAEVRDLAQRERWSMAEVCRRSGVKPGTFSSWWSGRYRGVYSNITGELRRWLAADDEARLALATQLVEPGFVRTPTAAKVLDALLYAQELPCMVPIMLGPGMGKTMATEHVLKTRPHTYRITLHPGIRTVPALNRELAVAVDVVAHPRDLPARIGANVRRNGRKTLIMADEAQELSDEQVNQLRHYLDVYKCGIALLGNEDIFRRWASARPKEGYGQLHRRFSVRVREPKPKREDVDAYLAAWGLTDPEVLKLLRVIGMKPGALGQIAETIKLAAIKAGGPIAAEHVRWAWSNRAEEDIHIQAAW